jgi:hypothetical protein
MPASRERLYSCTLSVIWYQQRLFAALAYEYVEVLTRGYGLMTGLPRALIWCCS